jgi:2-iminobutanoate/2-iminopropanoate deaminase
MAGTTIQHQTRQSLINCDAILKAAGASRDDIVDVQVLLANPADFAGMNEAYGALFPEHPPARSVCKLGAEIPNLLVSIRMTAVL